MTLQQLITFITGVNTQVDFDVLKLKDQKENKAIETETSSILQGAFLTSLELDL